MIHDRFVVVCQPLIDGTAKVKREWLCAPKGPPRSAISKRPVRPTTSARSCCRDPEEERTGSTADHERGMRASGNDSSNARALMRFSPFAINQDLAFPRVSRAIEIHPRPEIFIAGVIMAPVALLPACLLMMCSVARTRCFGEKKSKEPSSIFRIGRDEAG